MSVLPVGANLASYFVVLSLILILTVLAAIILQKNSTAGAEIDFRPPRKDTPREHLRSLIDAVIRVHDSIWDWLFRAVARVRLFEEGVSRAAHGRTENKFLFPVVFVFLLIRNFSFWVSEFTRFLFWDFPVDELVYTSCLLYRPPASVLNPRKFSFRKMILDILRFLFLPLWLALAITRGCLMLVHIIILACFWILRWAARGSWGICRSCCPSEARRAVTKRATIRYNTKLPR
jgi:hypothetical protein